MHIRNSGMRAIMPIRNSGIHVIMHIRNSGIHARMPIYIYIRSFFENSLSFIENGV